jgi:hypothetical protein
MGLLMSRSVYSATNRSLVLHRMMPMLGWSTGWRRRSFDRREIEVHLLGEFRFEGVHLQIDHHVRTELQVVKKQISVESLAANGKPVLASHKREPDAQFEKELA